MDANDESAVVSSSEFLLADVEDFEVGVGINGVDLIRVSGMDGDFFCEAGGVKIFQAVAMGFKRKERLFHWKAEHGGMEAADVAGVVVSGNDGVERKVVGFQGGNDVPPKAGSAS